MEQELKKQHKLFEFIPKESICFICKGRLENIHLQSIVYIEKSGMVLIVSRPKNIVSQFSAEILSQQGF